MGEDTNVLVFPDGSIYRGEIVRFKPDGKGILTRKNNSTHDGEWRDGYAQGYAKAVYPNGDTYEGFFQKGKRNGEGKYVSRAFEYTGTWENGKMNGNGKIVYVDGREYEG